MFLVPGLSAQRRVLVVSTVPPVVPPDEPGPPIKILCVDDSRDAADSEAMLLELVGYDTKACYDGRSAIKLAEGFHPRIGLLDLNMPGMDGDELAGHLRDQAAGRPLALVAVTAMSDAESRDRTTAAGFDEHLVKPVEPGELLAIVDGLSQNCHLPAKGNPASKSAPDTSPV